MIRTMHFVSAVALALAAFAPRADAQVAGASLFVAQTGEVRATYLGNTASYSNDLYLDSPANSLGVIFNNHATPVGTEVSLGNFNAGSELIFRLHVNNTGDNFYTGPGSRNTDNSPHALVTENWQPGLTRVDFEDLNGGPFVYNDLSFAFSNLSTTPAAVPEPGSLALIGASLLPLLGLRRRAR